MAQADLASGEPNSLLVADASLVCTELFLDGVSYCFGGRLPICKHCTGIPDAT